MLARAPRSRICFRRAYPGRIFCQPLTTSAIRQAVEERRASGAIGDATAGNQERERTAALIRQRVNLGGSPATGTANRLIFLPPFPPAAERWAFTAEESIINCKVWGRPY